MSSTIFSPSLKPKRLWAARAWLESGWAERVLFTIGEDGHWANIVVDTDQPIDATIVNGAALPGMVNAHSHAFQRAFAGMAERRGSERQNSSLSISTDANTDANTNKNKNTNASTNDNFWSWRDRMYSVALRITPDQLEAIAAQLFIELLRGGYTQVCEFHYLQHDPHGTPYDDPLRLSWAVADAADTAGIGLTMLPVLYERAGFSQPKLRDDQRRFASTPASVWAAREALHHCGRPLLNAGVAIHSLRAASPQSIAVLRDLTTDNTPIHIHVSEQIQEVEDCVATLGARPIAWLAQEKLLDSRWQLVHATHTVESEIASITSSGAGFVVCPSTEANLGDGFCDLPNWLASRVAMSIGSDSHISRDWREELRLLEYGQRLQKQQRNISSSIATPSTAERLWQRSQIGGAVAAGFKQWGLAVGARADLLVVNSDDAHLLGIPDLQRMDALVFSSPSSPWRDVMVAGQWVVRDHHHANAAAAAERFADAMRALWKAEQ